MMSGRSQYDIESETRQHLMATHRTLTGASQSVSRSQQIALETEQIGTEVISNLSDQRETLLRTKDRLTTADNELAQSKSLLRKMGWHVLYNKLILIGIIVMEVIILGILIYIKVIKN